MLRKQIISAGVLLVIASVLILSSSEFRKPDIRNLEPGTGTAIVAFGDSLVQGVGATKGNDMVSLLSKRIGRPIVNLGVSGNTTDQALDRLDEVFSHDPRIVIILLGGNDYLRRVPMEETFKNLKQIVEGIQERGAAVLLLGVRGGLLRDTYNSSFEAFAKENKTGFVPNVLDDIIGDDRLMSDAIHPNDLGYEKIADKVEPLLRKMIEAR